MSGVIASIKAAETETEGTGMGTETGTAVNGGSTDLTKEITGAIGQVDLGMIVITGLPEMRGQGTMEGTETIHVVKTRSRGPGHRSFCLDPLRQGVYASNLLCMQA